MRNLFCGCLVLFLTMRVGAAPLDTIGVTLLRTVDASLVGSGIRVAQPEASTSGTNLPPAFEVNPAAAGQPVSLFTYYSSLGTATTYPNSVGAPSGHAEDVGRIFYGTAAGTAPGVSHVDVYDAVFFYTNFIASSQQPAIPAKIVNQSFIFQGTNPPQTAFDLSYDNFAVKHNVLFVSGAGNGGRVSPPATGYNGIGVGAHEGSSSFGPTADNGRSKPDLTAPGSVTSYSTPYVAGAAAILAQAGSRGDGGGAGTTNAATDIRTLKALLLNGAVKPTNWQHTSTVPLDTNVGAGVLNVFNSYQQLAGGKRAAIETTTVTIGGAHPPGANTNNVASLSGWDFASISSTIAQDRVNHYYFNLTNVSGGGYTLTATLAWLRGMNESGAKNLNLFLYNASGSVVASSVSSVDNVEHIYIPSLAPGRYDLQVWKAGGLSNSGAETYALAFEMFTMSLRVERSGGNVIVSWPVAPTGFRLQSTASLSAPIVWSDVNAPVTVTDGRKVVTLSASAAQQYFRLVRP